MGNYGVNSSIPVQKYRALGLKSIKCRVINLAGVSCVVTPYPSAIRAERGHL
jgi:hypothetical protein